MPLARLQNAAIVLCLALAMSVRCAPSARSDYERVTGNPIPYDEQEQIVWRTQTQPAKVAVVGVAKEPTAVAQDVATLLREKHGVDDSARVSFDDARRIASYRSRPFHVTPTTSSVLIVEVFRFPRSNEWSVITMRREDRWKSRGREFHTGCPSLFKGWSKTSVVTKAELAMIVAEYEEAAVPVVSGLAEDWFNPLADVRVIADLHGALGRGKAVSAPDGPDS